MNYIYQHITTYQNVKYGVGLYMVDLMLKMAVVGATLLQTRGKSYRV
jgi:hypothetical protein